MGIKKLFTAIFSVVAFTGTLFGSDEIEWLQTEYDFGTFTEESGKKTGELKLINRGKEATIINKVRPTCGCTVAEFTEGEIAPGDTAFVRFTYNPAGRPGRFSKSLKVYIGAENVLTTLKLKGTVIGKKSTLSKQYPVEIGALRLSKDALILGDLTHGLSRHEFITGYNQSQDTIYPSWGEVPNSISIAFSNSEVAPGDLVTLSVYYNSRNEEKLGLNSYPIEIISDEKNPSAKGKIELTVNLKADTSKLTADDMKNAPSMVVEPTVIDLGTITGDKDMKVEFKIKNDGKSQMKVNRIYSFDKRFSVKKFPVKINPGKTEKAECVIKINEIEDGPFNIKAEVISNDPLHPTATVRIVGIRKTK